MCAVQIKTLTKGINKFLFNRNIDIKILLLKHLQIKR